MFLMLCEVMSAEPVFPSPPAAQSRSSRHPSAAAALASQEPDQQSATETLCDISSISVSASTSIHEEIFANIKGFLQPLVDSMSTINARLEALEKRPAAAAAPPVPITSSILQPVEAEAPQYNLASASAAARPTKTIRRHSVSPQPRRQVIEGLQIPPSHASRSPSPAATSSVLPINHGLNASLSRRLQSAQDYMSAALAPATYSSYRTAWNAYSRFCAQQQIIPVQFHHTGILTFIIHLRDNNHLSPSSIRSYLP
ncbi:hypothetical protein EOD39_14033 [Acipenser ruthenus]|uniref:Core-binding (CB) domain-containing protein n=1 Tax=Acipenser ruthenus TaxID=7906 RepID=A0A444UH90_ACIRT|nr:hypothetical protein EOD39_14033 [Acipenser ruthenus]